MIFWLSYVLADAQCLSGVYTIGGSSPNFANFTEAVDSLVAQGVCGPVVFNVRPGTYNEQITLPQVSGTSSSNTVVFQSENHDSTSVTLSYSASSSKNYIVQFNGADYITFSKITLQSLNSSYGRVVEIKNYSSYNQLLNNSIIGIITSTNSTNLALIYSGSNADTGNSFINNHLMNGSHGIYYFGVNSSLRETGTIISGNRIENFYERGVIVQYQVACQIESNVLIPSSSGVGGSGIQVGWASGSIVVKGNRMYGIKGSGIYLWWCVGNTADKGVIANNFIQCIGSGNAYGIGADYSSYQQCVFNSVNMESTGNNLTSGGAFFMIGGGNVWLQNNILSNTGGGMAVSCHSSPLFSDFNDLYATGFNLGSWQGVTCSDLQNWQSLSKADSNSISKDPLFFSSTNLHIQNAYLNEKAMSLPYIVDDIDGDIRGLSPDIGADEFALYSLDAELTNFSENNICSGLGPFKVTLKNNGSTTVNSATINWKVNGISQPTYNWNGSLLTSDDTLVSIGSYSFNPVSSYTLESWVSFPNGLGDQNISNDTIIKVISTPSMSGTYTIGGVSPDYVDFTSAVSDLISRGVCGPTFFLVRDGTYNEQLLIPYINGSSATNSITFKSQSGDSSQVKLEYSSGTSNNYTVKLSGAKHTSFETLSISALNQFFGRVLEIGGNSEHIKVSNCILSGSTTNTTPNNIRIILSDNTNDNNIILRNNIIKFGSGVSLSGNSTSSLEYGLLIENNKFISCRSYAVSLNYVDAAIVLNNYVIDCGQGILLINCAGNFIVTKNQVLGNSSLGIFVNLYSPTLGDEGLIANNMVSVAVPSPLTTCVGINVKQSSYVNVYFNNVLVNGTNSGNVAISTSSVDHVNVKNNNIINSGAGLAMSINPFDVISDYNNLLSAGTNIVNTFATLPDWIASSGKDSNSVSIDPIYTATNNLHINEQGLKGKGVTISSINTDFDGDLRFLPPYIGADELVPPPNDGGVVWIDSLNVICTPINTLSVLARNFGGNVISSLRINWSVNGALQSTVNWSGSINPGDTTTISLGNFNFSSSTPYAVSAWISLVNSVNDTVNYNDTAFYYIPGVGMNGTYTVGGVSPDYSSITDAVSDLEARGVCGPVIINIRDGQYNEQISIPGVAGVSSINTITFRSQSGDSAAVMIYNASSSTSSNYVLKLSNASFVNIENLTLKATGTSFGRVILLEDGAHHLKFRNNQIEGIITSSNSPNFYLIYSDNSSIEDSIEISSSLFKYGSVGVSMNGISGSFLEKGIEVLYNKFDSQAFVAIGGSYQEALSVVGNSIFSSATNFNSAINFYVCQKSNKIYKNKINIDYGSGIALNFCAGDILNQSEIVNNMISCINGTKGIEMQLSFNQNLYYNSVYTRAGSTGQNGVVYISGGLDINLMNNVLYNSGTGYVLWLGATNILTSSNYNNISGAGPTLCYMGTGYANLTAWKSGTGYDVNSLSVFPRFVSGTDLHLVNDTACDESAFPIAGIIDDLDGDLRNVSKPDIGADEIEVFMNDAGITYIEELDDSCASYRPVYVTLKNFGVSSLTNVTINWDVNGVPQLPYAWTGNLNSWSEDDSVNIGSYNFSIKGNNYMRIWTTSPNSVPDSNSVNDTMIIYSDFVRMAGRYTIGGLDPDYPDFNSAIANLKLRGVCDSVLFDIRDGTYLEQVVVPPIYGTSEINHVTFQSEQHDSSKVTLAYAPSDIDANYVLNLHGCRFIRFKELTFATNGTSYTGIIIIDSLASNNTFSNNQFIGKASVAPLVTGDHIIFWYESRCDSLTLEQNYFYQNIDGVVSSGGGTTKGLRLIDNKFVDQRTSSISMHKQSDVFISKNWIESSQVDNSFLGIILEHCDSNIVCDRNRINLTGVGMGNTFGMKITATNGTLGNEIIVSNNFISVSKQSNQSNVYSIGIDCGESDGILIYNNNINLFGDTTLIAECLTMSSLDTLRHTQVLNNCFTNSANGKAIAYSCVGYLSDYNNFYTTGSVLGRYWTNASSLASWKSLTKQDSNSVSVDPGYVSSTDLHVSNPILNNSGLPLSLVPEDFDGELRSITTPDIGADEFSIVTPGISKDVNSDDQFYVFPNPSTGIFNVCLKGISSDVYTVFVVNSLGEYLIAEPNITALELKSHTLDLSDHPKGAYHVVVTGVTGSWQKSLILY